MVRLWAQGDIVIEHVGEADVTGHIIECVADGSVILAGGEETGHHHRVLGSVTLYRDNAHARDIPPGIYAGHVQVRSASARLEHEEHAPISLARGTYRIRRQRQLEPTDTGFYGQYAMVED